MINLPIVALTARMINDAVAFLLIVLIASCIFAVVICGIIFYKERDRCGVIVPTNVSDIEITVEVHPPGKPTDLCPEPIAVAVFPPRVRAYNPRLAWEP